MSLDLFSSPDRLDELFVLLSPGVVERFVHFSCRRASVGLPELVDERFRFSALKSNLFVKNDGLVALISDTIDDMDSTKRQVIANK